MHDQEKSDSGIVAGKPTNKAGRPAAEAVEPRPETEGNADQQSTLRTQGRERVTQALDRDGSNPSPSSGESANQPGPIQSETLPIVRQSLIRQDKGYLGPVNQRPLTCLWMG